MIGRLLVTWQATLARLGCVRHPLIACTGEALLSRWSEPQRHYHTVDHLDAVLSHVDELRGTDQVRLAAWYHDAVYDPRRSDNEERSAALAIAELGALGLDPDEVARLVRLTVSHRPMEADRAGAVLCDADLAVLAAPAPEYRRYAGQVRLEYAHLDEAAWRAGRCAVLGQLLDRPRLFHAPGSESWEAPARENLSWELATLSSAPGSGAGSGGASAGAAPPW